MLSRVCSVITLKCLECIQQNNFQFPELLSHHSFFGFSGYFYELRGRQRARTYLIFKVRIFFVKCSFSFKIYHYFFFTEASRIEGSSTRQLNEQTCRGLHISLLQFTKIDIKYEQARESIKKMLSCWRAEEFILIGSIFNIRFFHSTT